MTLLTCSLLPAIAHAGVFTDLISVFAGREVYASVSDGGSNVQTMPLLRPAMNIDPSGARGGGDIIIVDDSALVPNEGPSGTLADIEKPKNGTISRYVVHSGDTLSGIAKMFAVSPNTILWANDLPRNVNLQVGQTLVILPVTGIQYTVKSGDTFASLAKKYSADADEIASFNGIEELTVGAEIIIPNGEIAAPKYAPTGSTRRIGPEPAHNVGPQGDASQIAYYVSPLGSYHRTQGIHGYNAVDLGAPIGTPIMASAAGYVVVARQGGWNGGYGSYVVISHGNGSQTLYSHMSSVAAYDGQQVAQGQIIGYVGKTGLATGPHLHFEIRNGIRNPF